MKGLRGPEEPQLVDGPSTGLALVFPGVSDLRFVLSTFSPPLSPSPETVILGAPSFSASLAPLVSACSQVFNPYHMLQIAGYLLFKQYRLATLPLSSDGPHCLPSGLPPHIPACKNFAVPDSSF